MKRVLTVVAIALFAGGLLLRAGRSQPPENTNSGPQYTSDGKLVRPQGYRRWVYLSSGFGMSYNPDVGGNGQPAFTNVFVTPSSYDYFLANGKWPDKTIFVLEEYRSTSHGSINQHGSYQEAFLGLDVEVKDESRFPEKWAYFGFDTTQPSSGAIKPAKNGCWNCHDQNAAVEHSFVQFYPELLKVAKEKGTIKPSVHLETK